MDSNITIFRGNKILFSSNIIDFFFTFVDTDNETKLQSIFFHFTEMRISTHKNSFLRFKLKLVTLVNCCSIEFFST